MDYKGYYIETLHDEIDNSEYYSITKGEYIVEEFNALGDCLEWIESRIYNETLMGGL